MVVEATVAMARTTKRSSIVEELKRVRGLTVKSNEPLARRTSIKTGGAADIWLEIEDQAALKSALKILAVHEVPVCVLGNGSNVLISDRGVRGAVVRLGRSFKEVEWREEGERMEVIVGAAYLVPRLVRHALRRGFGGLEFAEGIPGSVGGALVMNAGAYGSEFEKVVTRVEAVTPTGEAVELTRGEIPFVYRDSGLRPGTIVTRVHMRLRKAVREEADLKVRELAERRKRNQPSGRPNSGSMFRNPPGDVAGRLIEAAGLKGKKIGQAQISERHANFIINLGGARSADVRALMEIARDEVQKRFGVRLEPEVRMIGDWKN
jgi:UDP-N-acetylmuramate dehydrogenase